MIFTLFALLEGCAEEGFEKKSNFHNTFAHQTSQKAFLGTPRVPKEPPRDPKRPPKTMPLKYPKVKKAAKYHSWLPPWSQKAPKSLQVPPWD